MSKSEDWRATANRKRTRGLIANELIALFEVYDDLTIPQHLVNIMRSKGKVVAISPVDGTPKYRDAYYTKESDFLKDIEAYREELQKMKTEDDE